jgi:two-component system cell cycle sensor histidine kinase/response regulator CckA
VILCDLMMPGVGGPEVYAAVTRVRSGYAGRFVFMTGGAFTPQGRDFLESSQVPVITKPFDVLDMQRTVAAVAARMADLPPP